MMTVETCANCGQAIGSLETPHLWQDNIVCPACHRKLSAAATSEAPRWAAHGHASAKNANVKRYVLGSFALIAAGVGIVAWLVWKRDDFKQRDASRMAIALSDTLKAKEQAFGNDLAASAKEARSTFSCDFYLTSCDVQSSPSEQFPKVAIIGLSKTTRFVDHYAGIAYNYHIDKTYHITATIGRKDGRWHCIKAEERLDSILLIPEDQHENAKVGDLQDATPGIDRALESVP